MGVPARGDLVVVTFPFSDLSAAKLRPGLVVGDYILCQMTSQPYHVDGIEIDPSADVINGKLRGKSYVRPLKLFTAHTKVIKGVIGTVTDEKLALVTERIVEAITEGGVASARVREGVSGSR